MTTKITITGPGSHALDCPTSVVQGLAEVLDVPIVAVSDEAVEHCVRDTPAALMRHVGDLAGRVLTAMADDHLDAQEAAGILPVLDRLIDEAVAVRSSLAAVARGEA